MGRGTLRLLVAVLGCVLATPTVMSGAQPRTVEGHDVEAAKADIQQLGELFADQQFDAVVRAAGPMLARHGLTPATITIVVLEAESRRRLGDRTEAIRAYERVLPVLAPLNNVEQRRFSFVFFRLAMLAQETRQLDQAVARAEAGLRLEPQNTWGQILLGEILTERGDRGRALAHFKEVAASSFATSEDRAVLAMKIDRLTTGRTGASITPPDMRQVSRHEGLSIALVPLSDLMKEVKLADVCVALEAAWRIRCEVLAPLSLPEGEVFVAPRGQYNADRVLDELRRRLPGETRPGRYLLAVAGRDLFGPKTRFVFSWQTGGGNLGVGVTSAYRFAVLLDDFYEKPAVLMRRVIIQALSTTASMLGVNRPTNPECPTAFPMDFREFQLKRPRLCASDVEQRDAILRTRGGAARPFGDARSREIDRVYRAYYLD
jgi:predicted Zn-dependent protease